jgi:NAD(P)H-flavin reductase/hemoglobin-like flavoprotein
MCVVLPDDADAAMTYFYGQLFAMDHEIAAMFPSALDAQRRRLFRALTRIADADADMNQLTPYLDRLGRSHRKSGVRERHYEVFRRALLATMARHCADGWDEAAREAWEKAYDRAAAIMMSAATEAAEFEPAWWVCTVASVQPRAPDIAVLTLRPDQPVHYLPGQHISVQTLHWPRQWRLYSIANAPRADGTLTFHVRAVHGGMISHALVHHVRPGDPLVLGAPAGEMTADTASPRDVLCLAGGTGLAPVKAIVEAIIGTQPASRRREIALYYGARRRADLYDLGSLREMELAYPWLQVIPALSQEEPHGFLHGTIPEIAANASWHDRDVYISGPDAMIAKTQAVLSDLGAPAHLIHADTPGLET